MKAASSSAKATATMRNTVYIARRPDSIQAWRWARTPYSEAPIPYSAAARARIRQARPTTITPRSGLPALLVRELRRALGDERGPLPHERAALLAHGHAHSAALAERVRHDPGVADRHRGGPGAVAHAEEER